MRQLGPDGKPHSSESYVFGNEVGEQMSEETLRGAWERLREKAGLPAVHLADLRHEAGSRSSDSGVPLAHVSKMLGHANLTTTTRYLNVTDQALRRAVETLEEPVPPPVLQVCCKLRKKRKSKTPKISPPKSP